MSVIGLALSIAIIVWIVHKIDFVLLRKSLAELKWHWVIIMVVVYLLGFVIRGVRWHFLLSPIKHVGLRVATEGVVVGYMANNILPARAGELVRAIFVGVKESMSKASVLGTVLIERVFDGLVIVGILMVSSVISKVDYQQYGVVSSIIVAGCFIFGVAVSIVLVGAKRRTWIETKIVKLTRYFPDETSTKLKKIISNLFDALSFLKANKNLLIISGLSIIVWAIEGFVFWIGLFAFRIPGNLIMAYFILAFVNLWMLLPSAPGGLGVFQGGTVLAFSLFGLVPEIALSYSIVVHLVMILPISLMGLFILNLYGISIRKIKDNYNIARAGPTGKFVGI
jgi:uncharacterized protein (TIRG00374 family)